MSPDVIENWESWSTFIFFFIFVGCSFLADKINQWAIDKAKDKAEKEKGEADMEIKIKKSRLRALARAHGDNYVIGIVHNTYTPKKDSASAKEVAKEIKTLYKELLKVDDLSGVTIEELRDVLQPDTLLERFAYRKNLGTPGVATNFM
jgi:hypothetical protein